MNIDIVKIKHSKTEGGYIKNGCIGVLFLCGYNKIDNDNYINIDVLRYDKHMVDLVELMYNTKDINLRKKYRMEIADCFSRNGVELIWRTVNMVNYLRVQWIPVGNHYLVCDCGDLGEVIMIVESECWSKA